MSLLFPAYLLGLLGLALPWILHRFSDQQPPVQLFPSKQFLEATTPPASRKQTLRHKALLALRILALLLLCLLFTQPWINSSNTLVAQQLHHMIVVDQSLSMRAGERWSVSQDLTRKLIDDIGDESAQLIGFDRRISVLAKTGQDQQGIPSSLSAALDALQPGYTPADYGSLMQRLDRLAAEQPLPVKVWLVSDLQRSALPAQLNALYAPNVAELELVPVKSGELVNVHLVASAESGNGATANVSVSLLSSATNSEDVAGPIQRTLILEASGEVRDKRTVELLPGKLFVASFNDLVLPAESNPEFIVSLLEPDALEEDNTLRLPVTRQQPTSVVLLSKPREPVGSPAVFIATALETNGIAEVEAIRGTTLQIPPDTPNLLTGRELSKTVDQDVLQFVDGGNNALVFNNVETQVGAGTALSGVGIGAIDEAHPLALGDISWLGTEFYDLPEFAENQRDRVLLQTVDGRNVLVERETNRGRLLLLNDPLDGLASNLPLQPAFVALMQSLVRYFDASTSVPTQVVIGDRLTLPANVQLIDASGNAMLELADTAQPSTVALETPGLYTVVSARGEQSLRAILDSEEADLSTLPAESVAAWQSRYSDRNQQENVAESSSSSMADNNRTDSNTDSNRQKLWFWLLPVTAMLLFAEGWFANRRLDVRRDGS